MFYCSNSMKMRVTCKEPYTLSPWNYGDDFVIYHPLNDANTVYDTDWIRVVFGKGDFPTPTMKDGQFFTEEQLLSSEPLCVIGSNVSKRSTEIIDGEEYFTFQGLRYRVIGHIGTNSALDLDVIVMLNWGGCFEGKTIDSGVYLIDANRNSEIESVFSKAKEDVETNGADFLHLAYETTIRSFYSFSSSLYPISLIILIFSIIVVSIFYIDSISYQIAVKKLVGYSMWTLFGKIALKFIKYAFT